MKEQITKIVNFIKPLFCEDDKLSIGRIGLWILLVKILTIVKITAAGVTDVPDNLLLLTTIFIAYNFSKKAGVFVKVINAWKGHK